MKIAVAILNYNGVNWLTKFLPNVIEHSKIAEIYVIDNGSTDKSVSELKLNFPSVKLIINDENYGFAGGYNVGLKHIESDLYILLNSDIEVTPNWIEPIADFLEKNEHCAGAQPKILAYHDKSKFEHAGAAGGFIDTLGYPFCRGRIFEKTETDTGQYDSNLEIFWASGACLFIKSNVFWEVEGFDERYFAHMEEIDLCWRIHNLGKTFYCIPSSSVYHVGGGTLNYMSPQKTFLNFRNSLFTLHKNLDKNVFIKIFLRLCLDGVSGIFFLLKGQFKHTLSILKAHFSYYKHIPQLIKRRKSIQKKQFGKMPGVYKSSIVWEHFISKINTFSSIKIEK